MTKKFFVTTPIYYVNDIPHIGHAYATFAADILARYHRQKGDSTFFLTGTDENSQKTVQSAEKAGKAVEAYADETAKIWQSTWEKLGISNDDFIRTTESRHKKLVTKIFTKINEAGDIYKGRYVGLYCVGHEAFLKEEDLDENGECPDHKKKPDKITEENYFFRLSKYQDRLLGHFKKNPGFVQPVERYNEVVSFIKGGLQDISVTRATQKWGITAPVDEKHVVYVWFDALINYISAGPSKWPADLHIIGKDILRFHAVIWPAMLLSAGYELPKKVFAHGFFTINGQKISKSLGNAIDPLVIANEYGVDALRYFLFKEIPFGNDGDFSFERLKEVYNSDLANGLGNLVSRVAKLAEKSGLEFELTNSSDKILDEEWAKALEELRFDLALRRIWLDISIVDKHIEHHTPWNQKDKTKLKTILQSEVNDLREIAQRLKPFLPETSEKITKQFLQRKITSTNALFPRK